LMVNTSRGRLSGLPTTTASTSRRPIHHWSGTAWSTSARRGKLLLAECDGHPAGVGALHVLEAGTV
jgi:hypothetical protein